MPRNALPSAVPPKPEALPGTNMEGSALPDAEVAARKDLPPKLGDENIIEVAGDLKEIKATRMFYQRNGAASFYKVIQSMPLVYIFQMADNAFDEKRTPTKCLMDWVTAVTDDPTWTKEHFDDMTSEDIYRLLEIFLRLNRITELEEVAAKNLRATAAG